jgi:hypothetical protein
MSYYLQAFRSQDTKLWVHFLDSVRRGVVGLGECRVSHLVGTWLVSAWEVLRLPSHPLYSRLTRTLLAKPTLDLSLLPDFIPFYNDGEEGR